MKKKLIIVVIVLIIIFGGIYLWHKFIDHKINQFFANYKPAPVYVSVQKAKAATWHDTVHLTGSVIAKQGVNISPEVSGKIVKIYFKSGQLVKKGQPLILLNPNILKAELKDDQAGLILSKQNYDRQAALYKKGVASASDLDKFRAQYDESVAQLAKTKAQLKQTLVTAPFAGRLGLRQINLGQYVQAGDDVVSLQTVDPMYVDFAISENQLSHLKLNLPVVLQTISYPDKTFAGKIYAFNSKISNTSRSLIARAMVPNKSGLLKSGMFVTVNLILPNTQKVMMIPQISVTYTSSVGDYVYIIKDNKAERKYVILGERRGDVVAVTKGLSAGDQVVYAGQNQLKNGSAVVVEPSKETIHKAKTSSTKSKSK